MNYVISDYQSHIIIVGNVENSENKINLQSNHPGTSNILVNFFPDAFNFSDILFSSFLIPMTRNGTNKLRNSKLTVVSCF